MAIDLRKDEKCRKAIMKHFVDKEILYKYAGLELVMAVSDFLIDWENTNIEGNKTAGNKTAEEILKPYVERPFRHAEIVEKENALLAMHKFANQPKSAQAMSDQDKKQLEYEIRHIFESGENELRIFNMVVDFIEKRYIPKG
jgi:hypothetical protein